MIILKRFLCEISIESKFVSEFALWNSLQNINEKLISISLNGFSVEKLVKLNLNIFNFVYLLLYIIEGLMPHCVFRSLEQFNAYIIE